jgi:hypothetical protein
MKIPRPPCEVFYRDLWGEHKREELLNTLDDSGKYY